MRVLSSFYHPLGSSFKGVIVWGDKEDKGGQEVKDDSSLSRRRLLACEAPLAARSAL